LNFAGFYMHRGFRKYIFNFKDCTWKTNAKNTQQRRFF